MVTLLERMRELQADPDRYREEYAPPPAPDNGLNAALEDLRRREAFPFGAIDDVDYPPQFPEFNSYNRQPRGKRIPLRTDPAVPLDTFYFVDETGRRTGGVINLAVPEGVRPPENGEPITPQRAMELGFTFPPMAPGQTHWQLGSSFNVGRNERLRSPDEALAEIVNRQRPEHYRVTPLRCSCGFRADLISTNLARQQDAIQSHLRDDLFSAGDGIPRRYRLCQRCEMSAACREVAVAERTSINFARPELPSPVGPSFRREYRCDNCALGQGERHPIARLDELPPFQGLSQEQLDDAMASVLRPRDTEGPAPAERTEPFDEWHDRDSGWPGSGRHG
jgi:hypothetical protein